MGVRRKRIASPVEAEALSALTFNMDAMPELQDIPDNRYTLPAVSKKVDIFKGARFNEAELMQQLKNSKSFSKLFMKNKPDDMTKRPLLPLSIGQIGLIGGSGLINGLVDCDTPHIIKGRIVKEIHSAREDAQENSDNASIVRVTRSNKMVFNILTPDGFKSLI
jgi:hypothetical protein